MKYYVKVDNPDYLIGHGPDDEYIVIARTLSLPRAFQIAHLLNQNSAKEILQKAKELVEELREKGWTREDFANGLKDMLEGQ